MMIPSIFTGYVPKWEKRKIQKGDCLTGRIYSDYHINVWILKKNTDPVIGIAVSTMNKKRKIDFEILVSPYIRQFSFPSP